ncbi:MAG: hypothetical protein JNK29_12025 [Anaerolineales bacterium]|nr:hypothetical protein [Anaerolineales bacterium]
MPDELPILAFASAGELHAWLAAHHATSPGIWLRIFKKSSGRASVSFEAVLDEGLCFGWSESARRAYDDVSYLQRFTPRRTLGTHSPRNKARARALIRAGRMTPAGRQALGLKPSAPARKAGAR